MFKYLVKDSNEFYNQFEINQIKKIIKIYNKKNNYKKHI
jgi:hypothetical protein